jgi:hypothetical protein
MLENEIMLKKCGKLTNFSSISSSSMRRFRTGCCEEYVECCEEYVGCCEEYVECCEEYVECCEEYVEHAAVCVSSSEVE